MSGSQFITALNFNNGYGLPYTVFTPVYWAPLNSSGVGTPTDSTLDTAAQSGSAITPALLAATQANLAGISYTGLQTVSFNGLNSQTLIGSLFVKWGDLLGGIAQENANTFQTLANKSAKACGGFFSCLFG